VNDTPIRLGTRGSPLALAQAHLVRKLMCEAHGWPEAAVELVILKTIGDKILDRPLSEVGGKGLFTKELEEGLFDQRIDLAVHSMKDVETKLPPGLVLGAILPREDPRDRLIGPYRKLADLPAGARVGTSSLRRAAQLMNKRPDLIIVPFRGNVGTRLAKLEAGEADATILAAAGLNRLGHADLGHTIQVGDMLPAVAQGAIGIEIRADDARTREAIAPLNDLETADAVTAERAFLAVLDGSCRTPIAAYARYDNDGSKTGAEVVVRGEILRPDGSVRHAGRRTGDPSDAVSMARDLADELKSKAGAGFFAP
jgi:hydroxymethylbilane synthase